MTERLVLVEGPDDIAALHEVGARLFNTSQERATALASSHRVERDAVRISASGARIRLRAAPDAKSGLPSALAKALNSFPPQIEGDEARTDRVAVFDDPDDDAKGAFANRGHAELSKSQTSTVWTPTRDVSGDRWVLGRAGEARVTLRCIPWSGDGPVLDGLGDFQNLERLLCRAVGSAYVGEVRRIEAWLDEVRAARASLGLKPPKWKAAVLLWAALVVEGATSDVGIASRLFGQHKGVDKFFDAHVVPQIDAARLREPLAWVFE